MVTINLRTTKADKQALADAAKAAGVSLSAFLHAAAIQQARKILGAPERARPEHDYMLRGGPGFDYPCVHLCMIECAASECQEQQRCRDAKPR